MYVAASHGWSGLVMRACQIDTSSMLRVLTCSSLHTGSQSVGSTMEYKYMYVLYTYGHNTLTLYTL